MSNNKKYRLVNWVDGMAVDSEHFKQTEDYFIDALCKAHALGINKNTYGLLSLQTGASNANDIEITDQITSSVKILLKKCNAITAGGFYIDYSSESGESLSYIHYFEENKLKDTQQTKWWDVVLTANPFMRVPVGEPDPEATPPRHPDIQTSYKLSIVPSANIQASSLGRYHLVIGKVRERLGRFEVDADFIPPCTTMGSHDSLKRYHADFQKYISSIESNSKKMIGKILNRTNNGPLALHIKMICEEIIRYISVFYFRFRNVGLTEQPINIVNHFSSLAHRIYSAMLFISKSDKEEVLKYFYEWSDVTPGSFEDLLSNTLEIEYQHNNINTLMLQIKTFLAVLSDLWSKLSSLEFIGQHKENIVVSERSQQIEMPRNRGGWSVLD